MSISPCSLAVLLCDGQFDVGDNVITTRSGILGIGLIGKVVYVYSSLVDVCFPFGTYMIERGMLRHYFGE